MYVGTKEIKKGSCVKLAKIQMIIVVENRCPVCNIEYHLLGNSARKSGHNFQFGERLSRKM